MDKKYRKMIIKRSKTMYKQTPYYDVGCDCLFFER